MKQIQQQINDNLIDACKKLISILKKEDNNLLYTQPLCMYAYCGDYFLIGMLNEYEIKGILYDEDEDRILIYADDHRIDYTKEDLLDEAKKTCFEDLWYCIYSKGNLAESDNILIDATLLNIIYNLNLQDNG